VPLEFAGSREDFINMSMVLIFCYYLSLEESVSFHLNKLESSKNDLCQVCLKLIGQVILEKKSKMSKFTERRTADG
jgi:hypothetical protein